MPSLEDIVAALKWLSRPIRWVRNWWLNEREHREAAFVRRRDILKEQLQRATKPRDKRTIEARLRKAEDEEIEYHTQQAGLVAKRVVESRAPDGLMASDRPTLPAPQQRALKRAADVWAAAEAQPTFASHLLRGNAFYAAGEYHKALEEYDAALKLRPDDPAALNNLALLYATQGQYAQAEPLYKCALAITEKALGPDHPDVATSLNNLAVLYEAQAKYDQAEPLYKRALAISEKALGPDHPDVATSLNNLAELYRAQAKYDQAEPLYKRALAIKEKALGPDHPSVATSLNNLALLYKAQGKYDQAEPRYKRALAIMEKALGPDHPSVATSLENYALLLRATKREAEAKPLLEHAERIRKRAERTPQP